jgi:hypothetical protein
VSADSCQLSVVSFKFRRREERKRERLNTEVTEGRRGNGELGEADVVVDESREEKRTEEKGQ